MPRRHHLPPTRQQKRCDRSARWIKACADAEDLPDQAVPRGNQRPHWKDQGLRQFQDRCRSSARFGLSAVHLSSGRDRRRGSLGQRVHEQPANLSSHLRLQQPRSRHCSYQSTSAGETADDGERDHERINEISFNSSLMRAMRAIAFVTKLIDDGKILDNSMKRMLIHGIEAADVMAELGQPHPPDEGATRANRRLAAEKFWSSRNGIDRRHSR
jgi:hypothetical protein